MREVVIASHGRYAEGIVSGLNLLIGDDHGVIPVCAYCGEIGSTTELAGYFERFAQAAASRGKELILFTDMQGGSVNNTAVQTMMQHAHVHVVSGANLIMLMEFCMSEHSDTLSRINEAIAAATQAMQHINRLPEIESARQIPVTNHNDDTDDFFAPERDR